MSRLPMILAAAALVAPAAFAQGVFNPNQIPVRSSSASTAERNAAGSAAFLRHQRLVEERCRAEGCLVLVNDAAGYTITEARFADREGWGRNELLRKVTAARPYLLFADRARATCGRDVQLTLRGKGGATETRRLAADFCRPGFHQLVVGPDLSVRVAT